MDLEGDFEDDLEDGLEDDLEFSRLEIEARTEEWESWEALMEWEKKPWGAFEDSNDKPRQDGTSGAGGADRDQGGIWDLHSGGGRDAPDAMLL